MKYKLMYGQYTMVDVIYLYKGLYQTSIPYVTHFDNLNDLYEELSTFLPVTQTFKENLFQCNLQIVENEN